jgi:CNT family concentrative nucleoside transporter
MSRSELAALMVGGFATITGGLMAVYVSFGVSAGHLVVASIISAPAALMIAKILEPPEKDELQRSLESVRAGKSDAGNIIDAAARGTTDGIQLAINIIGMLIAFIALIAMTNSIVHGIGELVQWAGNSTIWASAQKDIDWSLSGLFGILFWPLAFVMGIPSGECTAAGNLLGTKVVVNEFVAYLQMGDILTQMKATDFDSAKHAVLSERTQLILTYALCGFSNFGAIGIQLGGIGALAPDRRGDLASLGLRAMLGGMIACCMTACIAGMLYGVPLQIPFLK